MDRKGDIFIMSRTSWQTASLLHVLSLRQAEVRQSPAPSQGQDEEAVILDKGACFRAEKILYQEYLQEPETRGSPADILGPAGGGGSTLGTGQGGVRQEGASVQGT